MSKLAEQVREFRAKYGHPVRTKPRVPSEEEVRFRLRLIFEEAFELLEASFDTPAWVAVENARRRVEQLIELCPIDVELPLFVDAMGDIAYVLEGTAATLGVDMDPVFDEIQRANMSKGPNGSDGKPVKPPGWEPPRTEAVLREQGWES